MSFQLSEDIDKVDLGECEKVSRINSETSDELWKSTCFSPFRTEVDRKGNQTASCLKWFCWLRIFWWYWQILLLLDSVWHDCGVIVCHKGILWRLQACFKYDAIDSDDKVNVEESEFDSTLIVTDQEYKCVEDFNRKLAHAWSLYRAMPQ